MDNKGLIKEEFNQFMTNMLIDGEQDDLLSYESGDEIDGGIGGELIFSDNLKDYETEDEEEQVNITIFLRRSFGLLFATHSDSQAIDMITDRMNEGNGWTTKFFLNGGVSFILERLINNEEDVSVQTKCLSALISLMNCNREEVVDELIELDETMKAIGILLYSESDTVRFNSLHLLAYMCSLSGNGVWFVLEVLCRYCGNDRVRFKSLIKEMVSRDHPNMRVQQVLMLFNQLVENQMDVELKRYLIDELYDMDLPKMLEEMRGRYSDVDMVMQQIINLEEQIAANDACELDTSQPQDLLKIFNIIRIQLKTPQSYESTRSILRSVLRSLRVNTTIDSNLSLIASILNRSVSTDGSVQDVLKQQIAFKYETSRQSKQLDQIQMGLAEKDHLLERVKDIISKETSDILNQSGDDVGVMLDLYVKHLENSKVKPPAVFHDEPPPIKTSTSIGMVTSLILGTLVGASTVVLWSYLRSKLRYHRSE